MCKMTPPTDVYNKIDSISLEQVDKLARDDHSVVISCEMGLKYVLFQHEGVLEVAYNASPTA